MLLPDIERGPTWSDEWRRECLVRSLRRRTAAQREAFYRLWEANHGAARAAALRRAVERAA